MKIFGVRNDEVRKETATFRSPGSRRLFCYIKKYYFFIDVV